MSLYITVSGQEITGYGKNGDIEISSYPSIDGQPANKDICYWNGSIVQLKTTAMVLDEYKVSRKIELREAIKQKGFFEVMEITGFTADQVVTAWGNFKTNLASDATKEEVDTRVDGVYTTLQLND